MKRIISKILIATLALTTVGCSSATKPKPTNSLMINEIKNETREGYASVTFFSTIEKVSLISSKFVLYEVKGQRAYSVAMMPYKNAKLTLLLKPGTYKFLIESSSVASLTITTEQGKNYFVGYSKADKKLFSYFTALKFIPKEIIEDKDVALVKNATTIMKNKEVVENKDLYNEWQELVLDKEEAPAYYADTMTAEEGI